MDLNYRCGDQAAMIAAWNELTRIPETIGGGPSRETIDVYESLVTAER